MEIGRAMEISKRDKKKKTTVLGLIDDYKLHRATIVRPTINRPLNLMDIWLQAYSSVWKVNHLRNASLQSNVVM